MAEIVLILDSRLEEIALLAERVDEFCESHDLPPPFAFHFNLCLDEVLTNVIQHGLDGEAGHDLVVRLVLDGASMTAEVVDDGPPFDPLQRKAPDIEAALEDREIGGLGIHLLRTIMDEVAYRRADNRNHLLFGKTLPS